MAYNKLNGQCLLLHFRHCQSRFLHCDDLFWWVVVYSVWILKKIVFEIIHNNKDVDGAVTQSLVVPIGPKVTKHEYILVSKKLKWADKKWVNRKCSKEGTSIQSVGAIIANTVYTKCASLTGASIYTKIVTINMSYQWSWKPLSKTEFSCSFFYIFSSIFVVI